MLAALAPAPAQAQVELEKAEADPFCVEVCILEVRVKVTQLKVVVCIKSEKAPKEVTILRDPSAYEGDF